MFNLFKKTCPVCGMKVAKKDAIVREGKYFCSEKCAEEYAAKPSRAERAGAEQHTHGEGSCCGGRQ